MTLTASTITDSAFSNSSVLRYSIFLTLGGAKVRTLHTGKFRKIYSAVERYEWDSAHLIVRYGDAGENEGIYTSAADVRAALASFIESENVEYLMGGYHG